MIFHALLGFSSLEKNSKTAQVMVDFIKVIEVSLKKKVCRTRRDNGTKFRNHVLESLINHELFITFLLHIYLNTMEL